jgi:hypothetical protein
MRFIGVAPTRQQPATLAIELERRFRRSPLFSQQASVCQIQARLTGLLIKVAY